MTNVNTIALIFSKLRHDRHGLITTRWPGRERQSQVGSWAPVLLLVSLSSHADLLGSLYYVNPGSNYISLDIK